MKKNLRRLVVFLIALIAVVPVMSVSALEPIENMEIANDGTITWDAFAGADSYKVNGEDPALNVVTADIANYIASPVSGTVYTVSVIGYNGGAEVASAEQQVLYRNGTWYSEFYSITYNTNGGSNVDKTYWGAGQVPEITNTVPTKSNYSFNDWYIDSNLSNRASFSAALTQNVTLYAGWNKIISSINVNITRPKVGDKVTIIEQHNQYGSWEEADKKPEVKFEDGAKYEAEWLAYISSFPSEDPAAYDKLFSGVFEKDGWYYVELSLYANDGFVFDGNDNITIKVNGETINIEKSEYNSDAAGSKYYMFYAKVKADDGTEEATTTTTEENNTSNPNTGDEILFYIGLLAISILGYTSSRFYSKKKLYN